ncbi:MAG: fibronectin type III domain-containing protein [Wolinella sp.]
MEGFGAREAISDELPRVESIRMIADVSSVAFEWDLVNDSRVDGYYLYRKEANEMEFLRIGRIDSRFGAHYVDGGLKPNTEYFYKILTYNKASNTVSRDNGALKAQTLSLAPLSFAKAMSSYPRKIKVLWAPHVDPRVSGYVIEREDRGEWRSVGEVNSRLLVEYLDTGLEDGKEYQYRVIPRTHDGVLGVPSEILRATTKPKPPIIRGIEATSNLPRRIELTWNPSGQNDVISYRLYRSARADRGFSEHATLKGETHFSDTIEGDGREYFYKVSAIDADGIESLLQESPARGCTLPLPNAPLIESARVENAQVVLHFSSNDPRGVEYVVYKREGGLFGKSERFISVKEPHFYDREVSAGAQYHYSVASVDGNGLESKRSEEVTISFLQEAR